MSTPNSQVLPALVVGAGPTGLMAAGELARLGVGCRLIDKRPGPGTQSRAIAVQARTLEIFGYLGMADELISRGVKYHGASAFVSGKRIAHVSMDELESPFPFVLGVPQTDTEEVLRNRLPPLGVNPEWNTELTGFRAEPEGVTVSLRRPDGSAEEVRTRWLIGCDGAHSTVRKLAGFTFEGETYQQGFGLADLHLDWTLPHDEVLIFPSPEGLTAAFPLPGPARYRLIWETEPARAVRASDPIQHGQISSSEKPEPTLEDVRNLLAERVSFPVQARDPVWMANFRVNSRITSAYRSGRVFVAGDAAHIHSPAGGQGMNTGLQDVFNLAWKLALAERGLATQLLLDSYQAERHHVGVSLLRNTDRLARFVLLRHPVLAAVRNATLSVLTTLEVVQQRARNALSELAVTYRHSPAVREDQGGLLRAILPHGAEDPGLLAWRDFANGPHAGDRAPDGELRFPSGNQEGRLFHLLRQPTRHLLLLFAGRQPVPAGLEGATKLAALMRQERGDLVRPYLIAPGGNVPGEWAAQEDVLLDPEHHLHDRYGARSTCLYLLRPDGYVGYRAQPGDAEHLGGYLASIFGAREEVGQAFQRWKA